MATKHNDPCREKAADDEPLFTLLARDMLAPLTIRQWAVMAIERGKDPRTGAVSQELRDKVDEALAVAKQMEAWPNRKYPD